MIGGSDFHEARVSGHIFRIKRRSGDRWMIKWRDAAGQHQRALGRVWTQRGRPRGGYLTKQGAERELDAVLADARRGQLIAPLQRASKPTVSDAAEAWLAYIEHDRKRRVSTVSGYRLFVRNVVEPEFGKLPLDQFTTRRIERWRRRLVAESDLAAATINRYLAMLNGIAKRAQREFGLAGNPVDGVDRQPVVRSGDFQVLSAAEVEALARAAASPMDAAIFTTAAYAGLRLGELRALRWRDVDFEKSLLHVRRNYVMRNEHTPKSGRVRSVPLIDQVGRVLDELSRRERFTGEEDLVFSNDVGEHFEDSALRRRFYAALKAAELKPIRFHDLRHSFGTLAVQVFPLTDVKAFMGHADIATTMIYVHHVPQHDAAAKLSKALESAATPAAVAAQDRA